MSTSELPSWRPGATRDALDRFLASVDDIPPSERVAVFDNDGTLWCEKPAYPQLAFFLAGLDAAVAADPQLRDRPEYAALLDGDRSAQADLGLHRLAAALADLYVGIEPAEFDAIASEFLLAATHPTLGIPYARATYRPMLELLDALARRGVANCIVTGGGTEFVRAISLEVYGVPPERVVGTSIEYEVDQTGPPRLRRTSRLRGEANEGSAKVSAIQAHLGRRPVLAAGNSAGDWDMLAYTSAGSGPTLSLLVDHDDADREFAYEGAAATFDTDATPEQMAAEHGWVRVSMAGDWDTVF